MDGGDITFCSFRGIVYLHMQGACAGCPSSTTTLKMGIENMLRHYIPEVTEVKPVVKRLNMREQVIKLVENYVAKNLKNKCYLFIICVCKLLSEY